MTLLRVSFAKWPSEPEGAWRAALAAMGVEAQFHPDFDPVHPADRWCAVALGFASDTLLPVEHRLRGFGLFVCTFGYEASQAGAVFSISFDRDLLGALVCACALAAATGGSLVMEGGLEVSGSSGAELLSQLVPQRTLLQGDPSPARFKGGWQV